MARRRRSSICPSATATFSRRGRLARHSPTASSWSCSAPRAAARRRPCAWSRASSSRRPAASCSAARDVTTLPPWKRNAGLVFQSYALFPHLSVAENVAFGLEMRKMPTAEMRARSRGGAAPGAPRRLSATRLPRQLSGGQQQRVALARALAFRPDVLLLDEPLSNLDAKLRQEVRVEIRELQRKLGLTTVMVTHDQEEALTMADRLVVMSEGECARSARSRISTSARRTNSSPIFVGRTTFLDGQVAPDGASSSAGGLASPAKGAPRARPRWRCARSGLGRRREAAISTTASGAVEFISYLGSRCSTCTCGFRRRTGSSCRSRTGRARPCRRWARH